MSLRRATAGLGVIVFLLCIFAGRTVGVGDVFTGAGVFLADADCYARLQRALPVVEGRAWVVRHHDFENAPEGTTPHTTAPLDWLLAAAAHAVAPWTGRDAALEVGGAWLPVALGLAAALVLWAWARRQSGPVRWLAPLLFAASPAIAWTSAVGRPDHHALAILLVTAALALEWPGPDGGADRPPGQLREIASGLCWGLALWVSLYEPLLLFACRLAGRLCADRALLRSPAFRRGLVATGTVLALAMLLEGWRLAPVAADLHGFAAAWAASIGELRPGWQHPGVLLAAAGSGVLAAPFLLLGPGGRRAHALPIVLWVATLALALWQIRWTPFLALAGVLSLPAQFRAFRWHGAWMLAAVPVLLWPMLREWDRRLDFPQSEAAGIRRAELISLRSAAARMEPGAVFIAPWWLSPPLAWWSRGRGIAGSSHESLEGIRDTTRFYAADDPSTALAIAGKRGARYVIAPDPGPVLENAAELLGTDFASARPMAVRLFRHPTDPPAGLRLEWTDGRVHLFVTEQGPDRP
jgi:hypothetical protein